MAIAKEELERIHRINNMMNDLHQKLNNFYEALIDRDEQEYKDLSKELMNDFRSLNQSYKQELK